MESLNRSEIISDTIQEYSHRVHMLCQRTVMHGVTGALTPFHLSKIEECMVNFIQSNMIVQKGYMQRIESFKNDLEAREQD